MNEDIGAPKECYPGFDVLSQQDHWDPATRRLVLDRVHEIPPTRFFDDREAETLQAVADTVLPQDDRPPERRIPIVPLVDQEQHRGETPGFRYEDIPEDRTAWRWGLEGVDQTSRELFDGKRFVELNPVERREVLGSIQRGDAPGDIWGRMSAARFFTAVLMHGIIGVYYAHPYAWNEIGYGGPAYPRGYYALNHGVREHWEVDERR